VKRGKYSMGLDHLSKMESGESGGSLDNELPNTHMFRLEAILDYFKKIAMF
jgi:hypothetical protein